MNSTSFRGSAAVKTGVLLVQLALAGMSANVQAQAQDSEKIFSLSGFGTAAVTHASVTKGDYVADTFEAKGAGYSGRTSATTDSKFAAQLDARFNDSLSAVLQVVMRSRPDNTFSPEIEWANVKYAVNKDLSVRLGRTALPMFMVSETRQVGFASPWLRPPIETYSLYSLTNSDGIDASYRLKTGALNHTFQAWHGKTKVDTVNAPGSVSHDLKGKITGVADTIDYGHLSAKIGMTDTDFELPVPGRILAFKSKVVNAGAIYDPGAWFVQGEITRTKLGTLQRASLAAYITAGYRIDQFTPYLTYSKVKADDNQIKLALRAQTTTSAGVRWDFMKNMDFKVQVDRVALAKGSTGFYTNVKPGLAGTNGTVISAAVDFVF